MPTILNKVVHTLPCTMSCTAAAHSTLHYELHHNYTTYSTLHYELHRRPIFLVVDAALVETRIGGVNRLELQRIVGVKQSSPFVVETRDRVRLVLDQELLLVRHFVIDLEGKDGAGKSSAIDGLH